MTQLKICNPTQTTQPRAEPRGAPNNVVQSAPNNVVQSALNNIVQLPPLRFPNEAARLRMAASHRDECADCIHMALVCLLGLALMLLAASLLGNSGIQLEILRYLLDGIRFLAASIALTGALALCLALVHFIQLRQL